MTDDRDLRGLDPYDHFDREAERLASFFLLLDGDAWKEPTRCDGWDRRDLLGHLRSDEDYFEACLDGRVAGFMGEMGAKGATDMDTGNAIGVAEYAGVPTAELIDDWQARNAETRRRFRERDGGEVDTSVGGYPARWQAFHLASELAIHADDLGVPVTAAEAPDRTAWRVQFSRFAVRESHPDVEVEALDGATRVQVGEKEVTLPDAEFVEAVAARLSPQHSLDAEVRDGIAAM